MNIQSIADKLIRKYKTRDPFRLISDLGGFVVFAPLSGVRGFYQYYKRNHIVYIDEDLSDRDQYLVCAHELGHMMIHKQTNSYRIQTYTSLNVSRYEKEANEFAIYLLISPEEIKYCREREYTVDQISRLYGYNESLIKLRLDMEE